MSKNFMQAYTDKQKQIIFGKMLHVDSDSYSRNEPKIMTNCIRLELIQHEIIHLLRASYLSIKLVHELCQNTGIY